MNFFKRSERGRLEMRTLDLQIFFDEIFDIAQDEDEVEWILENIQGVVEMASEEKIMSLD